MLEVLAVLILLGILTVSALLVLGRSGAQLAGESAKLAGHIRYLQMRALADISIWELTWLSASSYQISRQGGSAVPIPGEGGTTAVLDAGITSNQVDIRLDSWGRPVDGSGNPLATPITLTLGDGADSAQLSVLAGTGYVR